MNLTKVRNIVVIALILLISYIAVDQFSGNNDFKRKMNAVRKTQDSLLHVVDSLERTAHERDMQLKFLIETNLTLLESVNNSMKISRKKQDSIKQIIQITKHKIDSLWSANPE